MKCKVEHETLQAIHAAYIKECFRRGDIETARSITFRTIRSIFVARLVIGEMRAFAQGAESYGEYRRYEVL